MNETRIFADEVVSGITKYFPEDRQIQCRVVETMKNNNVAHVGITFHEQGDKVGPVIYMEPYREAAIDGRPMSEIMREIAGIASRSMDKTERIGSLDYGDYESVKEYLSVTLINGRDNRQMLSRMPHRQMEDLALILELKFPMEEGVGSIKVSHELAELWAVDTDTLFAQAQENSLKAEPPSLHRMEDTMLSLAFGRDAAENLLNQAKRARKKLKEEDRSRLDPSVAALEEALRSGSNDRIKAASDELESILRSVGTYVSHPESENDDGAFDA